MLSSVEKNRAYCRRYYSQNKERLATKNALPEVKQRRNAAVLRYYYKNRNTVKAAHLEWKKKNPDKNAEHTRRYDANKRNATPQWLTKEHKQQILDFYKEAKRLTELTGVRFQVDHIVPLKNDIVQGLHVPWNLQVLPYYENIAKHNKL